MTVIEFLLTSHGGSGLLAALNGDGPLVCCVPILGILVVLLGLGATVYVMLRGKF
jgi:hypothetical protein